MIKLEIPYATWKAVAQANTLSGYHIMHSEGAITAWCGTVRMQYHAHVDSDDFEDWETNFSASTEVESNDDAIAHIIGIDNASPAAPVDIAGVPLENDGRMNIVNAPMTHGMSAWWTGRGDDLNPTPPSSGRGTGTPIDFEFTDVGDETITLDFNSYIEIYDGEGIWHPAQDWTIKDRYWVGAYIRKNQDICVANGSGTGNCNVVNTGMGFSIIVPAPMGDGGYDIDLAKARPVPTGSDINYWRVDEYQNENPPVAAFTPDYSGPAGNHGLLYDLNYEINFCNDMPMGSPRGNFEIDSDKSEAIHKNWQVKVRCKRTSTTITDTKAYFGVWLKFFRPTTAEPVF